MEAGKWSFSIVGRNAKTEPTIRISNTNGIQVNTTGGLATIFSASNSDVKMTQEFESLVGVVRFRPHDGLTYRFKVGDVRNFDLEFSSGSQTNKLRQSGEGLIWGLGAAWNVLPGTLVTPAITLDLGFTQTYVSLDRFQSPGVDLATDKEFVQDELQGALNISKRFKQLEPYAGLKIIRVVSTLTDGPTKGQLRGKDDFVSPFVGISAEMFPGESVFLEGSFVDEKSINFGFNFIF